MTDGDARNILLGVIGSVIATFIFLSHKRWIAFFRSLRKKKEFKETQVNSPKFLSSFTPVNENEIVGRENDLQEIFVKLQNNTAVLLLNGVGGIGKTTLATLYAQKNKGDYTHVVWINAAQGIYEGFVADGILAHSLGLEEKLKQLQENDAAHYAENGCKEILNALRDKENSLLIIDNEQNQTDVVHLLKNTLEVTGQWKILITARETITGIEYHKVDELNEDEARALFKLYYTREENDRLVDDINTLLHRHTLMIELIAKNANDRNNYTLAQLKDDLQKGQTAFMEKYQVGSNYWATLETKQEYINNILKNAFTIAEFEDEEGDNEETANKKQFTRQLLTYWCLMPERMYVPFDTFCQLCQLEAKKETTEDTLNTLSRLGWLEHNTNRGAYLMHHVIQYALRWQMKPWPEDINDYIDAINTEMDYHFNNKYTRIGANWLQQYIETIMKYFLNKEIFSTGSYSLLWKPLSKLVNHISMYFRQMGDYNKALEYGTACLEIRKFIIESDDKDVAISYSNISLIYMDRGDLDKALEIAMKALKIREKLLDESHPDLATSYSNIGLIYKNKGDLDKAFEFVRKAINIREAVQDPKKLYLATSYGIIAGIYKSWGNLEMALEYAIKSLKIKESILEANHPSLATSYFNIAGIFVEQGEFNTAKELIINSINIYSHHFPEGHPNLDTAKNWLGLINKKLGG